MTTEDQTNDKSVDHPLGAPIICPAEYVIEDWIDYNGHLNLAYYNVIFDHGVDHMYDFLEIGEDYARSGIGSCFTLEVHINYLQELSLNDEVQVQIQLLNADHKRLHYFSSMFHVHEGYLAATSEHIALHVDMQTRKSAPFPAQAAEKIETLRLAHAHLPVPEQVGRVIKIPGS